MGQGAHYTRLICWCHVRSSKNKVHPPVGLPVFSDGTISMCGTGQCQRGGPAITVHMFVMGRPSRAGPYDGTGKVSAERRRETEQHARTARGETEQERNGRARLRKDETRCTLIPKPINNAKRLWGIRCDVTLIQTGARSESCDSLIADCVAEPVLSYTKGNAVCSLYTLSVRSRRGPLIVDTFGVVDTN